MKTNAFNNLESRGFIYQHTDKDTILKLFDDERVTFYIGFDPTADSLHVGHLLPIMAMRQLQLAGHKPIVLVGGATALVGDPSGKQEARPILTKEQVSSNVKALKTQLGHFISISDKDVVFVNNADWFQDMGYLDFLREIGYRFSINKMLAAESVKLRLETGLSFLEFNYMLLQAYDFHILNREYGCKLQLGGQDQWGNIVAGVDLVRKISSQEVSGITFPLLTDSQGQKFGKTAAGAVWLDTERTSIFDYYQFWRSCDDKDVIKLLAYFTALPMDEINTLGNLPAPAINRAKEILAYEATALAHGPQEAEKEYLAVCSDFGFADPEGIIETTSGITRIKTDSESGTKDLPTYEIPESSWQNNEIWLARLLKDSGLSNSTSEARRLIKGGGAYLNGKKITDENFNVKKSDFSDNSAKLKAGKKNVRRIVVK